MILPNILWVLVSGPAEHYVILLLCIRMCSAFLCKVKVHIQLVCHKLGNITFPTKMLPDFYNSYKDFYKEHSAIVWHNTKFATVYS